MTAKQKVLKICPNANWVYTTRNGHIHGYIYKEVYGNFGIGMLSSDCSKEKWGWESAWRTIQKELENKTESKMKKSEGELLREYAKIITEAEDQPDGFGDFEADDENAMWSEKEPALHFNDGEEGADQDVDDEPESEINSGDPIADLVSFIEGRDKHTDVPLEDDIKKFLHIHNLEITPLGGLSNSNGAV